MPRGRANAATEDTVVPTANTKTDSRRRTKASTSANARTAGEALLGTLPKADLLDMYHQMFLIRRFEERSAEQYAYGKIGGFLHLYIGEEAVAVGAIRALRPQDHLVTHYRDHGYALAIGADPGAVMAELFGRVDGTTKGRGGSMHLTHVERHFWGGYAIVAGHIPIATGLGLALKRRQPDAVTLCIFGDGATNAGAFHEALNMAAVWKVPTIFLCENNLYAMGTGYQYISAMPSMATKAVAYDIPAETVDGQDVLAMYDVTQRAIAHCTAGNGPFFIEAMTYRFRGHSMADPETYRTKDEVEEHRSTDPIERFKQQLLDARVASDTDLSDIEQQVEQEVERAIQFADQSPPPDPSTIYDHVYADGVAGSADEEEAQRG